MTDFANQISIEALIQTASSALVNEVALEPWIEADPAAFALVNQVCIEIWLVPQGLPQSNTTVAIVT